MSSVGAAYDRPGSRSETSRAVIDRPYRASLVLLLQVGDLGLSAKVFKELRSPLRSREPRNLAFGIVQIAENQRRGGTRLHARRLDLTVFDVAVLRLRRIFSSADALHTKRALLENADLAQR